MRVPDFVSTLYSDMVGAVGSLYTFPRSDLSGGYARSTDMSQSNHMCDFGQEDHDMSCGCNDPKRIGHERGSRSKGQPILQVVRDMLKF